jgi:hypothetical protein
MNRPRRIAVVVLVALAVAATAVVALRQSAAHRAEREQARLAERQRLRGAGERQAQAEARRWTESARGREGEELPAAAAAPAATPVEEPEEALAGDLRIATTAAPPVPAAALRAWAPAYARARAALDQPLAEMSMAVRFGVSLDSRGACYNLQQAVTRLDPALIPSCPDPALRRELADGLQALAEGAAGCLRSTPTIAQRRLADGRAALDGVDRRLRQAGAR